MKRRIRSRKAQILLLNIIILFIIYLINRLSLKFGGIGGGVGDPFFNFFRIESILVITIVFILSFTFKKTTWSYLFIAITIFSFYIFYNVFYIIFLRVPSFSDIYEIPELLEVASLAHVIIASFIILIYLFTFFKLINYQKNNLLIFVCGLLIFVIPIKIFPNIYIKSYGIFSNKDTGWNKEIGAKWNGYLNFSFNQEAKKTLNYSKLKNNNYVIQEIKLSPLDSLPNIHFIVLESFFDPNLFNNLSFSTPTIHSNFEEYYKNQNISIAPVYGGNTAQSEFEILTGAPALQKYGSIEFNTFNGNPITNSLPRLLKSINYKTIATNAYKPDVFNSFKAYKGLGFEQQYYINGNTYLQKDKSDDYLYDGDLLNQNLMFIDSILSDQPKKPIFNYILGMYGHLPNKINKKRQFNSIDIYYKNEKLDDSPFTRSVNQIYQRTFELAEYINKLSRIDPNSLIIIIGDHYPIIPNYESYNHALNNIHKMPLYIIDRGNPIKIDNQSFHHYNLFEWVLNRISDNNVNTIINNDLYYEKTIYESIK